MSKTYAHLLSSVAAVKAKEVDGDKNADRMEDDTPPANDKEDGKKSKKAATKKAESEKDEDDEGKKDEDREDKEEKDEQDDEDREDKKSKKSKKASAGLSSAEAQAVTLEERLRCATILSSKASTGRIEAACQFAFHTDLSADSAIAILNTLPRQEAAAPAKRPSLDDRMAKVANPDVGSDALPDAPAAQGLTEQQLAKMDSSQMALAIVNSGRALRGEALLTKLPN